jgi:hypothetical protein
MIITAWTQPPPLKGNTTGLRHECPEIEERILQMGWQEFSERLVEFEKYYLFCHLTPEYATYLLGAYLLFGVSEWQERKHEGDIFDPIAENLYYFLTGQRWPIHEIAGRLTPTQLQAVCDYVSLTAHLIPRFAISPKTKALFPKSMVIWIESTKTRTS